MKNNKWYVISTFVLGCIVVNFAGRILSDRLQLPLWLDSFGTVTAAYVLGPFCGAMVGMTVNLTYGILYSWTNMFYAVVSAMVGITTGICAKKGFLKNLYGVLSTSFLVAVLSVTLSVPFNYLYCDGSTQNIWGDGVIESMEKVGFNSFFSHCMGQFYLDFLDKVITIVLVCFLIKLLQKKIVSKRQHTLLMMFLCILVLGMIRGETVTAKTVTEQEDYSSYFQTVYGKENGIPGGCANDIVQTKDGVLWIGTYGGLYRYNGTKFQWINEYESIKTVNCLYTDEEGRLWVGTNDSGLSIFINDTVANVITEKQGLASDSVRCITQCADGNYYVGTAGALSIVTLAGGLNVKKTMEDIVYVKSMDADANGTVAAVTDDGKLYFIRQGKIMDIVEPSEGADFSCCKFDENGLLYAGTSQNEILCYGCDTGEWKYRETKGEVKTVQQEEWRNHSLEERLGHALIKGITDYLTDDLQEALTQYTSPVEIIEGPLMKGMERVGQFFGEGKMFLPQVVKSAKVMKEAVHILQPEIERHNASGQNITRRPRVVIATVKGDVHDIGKNIVNIVLTCNNLEVIDLGVMVDNQSIIKAAKEHGADIIGVSGLITPSLGEMENLCELLQKEQLQIPLIVGGATTSTVHTAVKLAPKYDYCVVSGGDASRTVGIIKRLLSDRENYIREIKDEQENIRTLYNRHQQKQISLEEARRRAPRYDWDHVTPTTFGEHNLLVKRLNLEDLVEKIDWTPFFHFWGFKGKFPEIIYTNDEADRTYQAALDMLGKVIAGNEFDASIIVRFFDAYSENEDIVLDGQHRFTMPRQQTDLEECLSLADFVIPKEKGIGSVGLFCLKVKDDHQCNDCHDFEHLLRESLCARLAEACAEWMQEKINEGTHVIRPAFGYPTCPDHAMKKLAFDILDAPAQIGVQLTEGYSIYPSTSLCGMLISHPKAKYFSTI